MKIEEALDKIMHIHINSQLHQKEFLSLLQEIYTDFVLQSHEIRKEIVELKNKIIDLKFK